MAEASRTGSCVECARAHAETEAVRAELHRTHQRIVGFERENALLSSRVAELEARMNRIEQIARGEHDPGRE